MTTADGQPRVVTDEQIDYSLNCFLCGIPQDRIDALLRFRKEYRMLLLSNTNPIGMNYCRKLFRARGYDVKEIFERLYLSYQMRVAKPGIIPEETLYIDDSPANVEAGRAAGLHSLLFSSKEDLYGKISEYLQREQR